MRESLKSIAHLDKQQTSPPSAHRDGTQYRYGSRRGATRSFRRHHTSEISSAFIVFAETLLAHAEG